MTLKEAKFCIGDFLDVSINSPNGRMDRWVGWTNAKGPYLTLFCFTGLETDVEVLGTGEASAVADLMTGGGMEAALGDPGLTGRGALGLTETGREALGLLGTEREDLGLEGIAKGALVLLGSERGALETGIERIDPLKEEGRRVV